MMKQQEELTIVWKRNEHANQSLEVLTFEILASHQTAKGRINGLIHGKPVSLAYQITLTNNWYVKELTIQSSLYDKSVIQLQSDLQGYWFDADGNEMPTLQGCFDIDISLSPFTNSIPIKRLGEQLLQRTALDVVYIDLMAWECKKVSQYYTKKISEKYLYEGVFRNFQADLIYSKDGFIQHYPSLFDRLF
jgi:hypothetical protein